MIFISCEKLFPLLRYLNFCPDFLVRKSRLISNFMTSQTGQQIITISIFSNISRSKGNQTMKFGQLKVYNMRNIFLKESYAKCGGKASTRAFYKKSKYSISLDQQS